jgi:hypothetical protein
LAEGLHDWGMRAVPLLSYTLTFSLQLRKSKENLSQGRGNRDGQVIEYNEEKDNIYTWKIRRRKPIINYTK